jgi:ubiquinone/menaquinone biosynthesis C-methylase UbiE
MAGIIDWSQIRQNMLLAAQRIELCNPSYWDKEACAINENMSHWAELTKKQLKILPATLELTVLDVGAGTGRMTLPMAERFKHLTALEPSEKMLAALKENALKQGIFNIYYVNKSIEDLDLSPRYDLVVASFSLFMFDIKSALLKMNALANRAVYLFLAASPWLDEALQRAVYGSSSRWSDFIFIYNILYEAGIFANVEICDYTLKQSYANYEDATSKFLQTYHIPSENKDKLAEYLRIHLVEEKGKLWSTRKRKAAAIWWTKNQ